MQRLALLLGVCALASACGTPPPKIAQTVSGLPEITIATDDRSKVKQNLIARNLETGWALEQESENTLMFSKLDTSGSASSLFTQALIGNSSSTPLKYEARYTFAQTGAGLKIAATVFASTQMPGGQVNRLPLHDGAVTFNAFQAQLQRVKGEIEAR